jgi:signal transduction histidine kinase
MSLRSRVRALIQPGRSRLSQEAGAAVFQGLRLRLTLWYCGVLGAALLLFGVLLYIGTQFFLLNPIQSNAAMHAQAHAQLWLAGSQAQVCSLGGPRVQSNSPPGQGFQMPERSACFDQNGSLLAGENTEGLPSAFLANGLAKTALQTGQSASDSVDAGNQMGQIFRYALPVPAPSGSGYAGVVLIGESIKEQEDALTLLLRLLLGVGGGALLGAGLGGLFLANRALDPARLAWANQQRFIADAAHELRTPLTLLRADAEVLLRGRERLEEEDAALLEDIVAEAQHMSTLASNLLTLARLDNAALHPEHEVVDLARLARENARRVLALAAQRGISVQTENSGAPIVIGDSALLEQALLVLLDNAIKYNRPRGGHITVRTATRAEQALLEVIDSGIGISAADLAHLGERFYRVDKARSREAGGTGLGLSIARTIMRVHAGRLSLSSLPGQGTTATLILPLAYAKSRAGSDDTVSYKEKS